MKHDWQTLTCISEGSEITVKEVKIKEKGLKIKGNFELPPLANLNLEEQVFIASFIHTNGSIREMEKLYGVSYPTIKAKLARLSEKLSFLKVEKVSEKKSTLEKLKHGDISVKDALKNLEKMPKK